MCPAMKFYTVHYFIAKDFTVIYVYIKHIIYRSVDILCVYLIVDYERRQQGPSSGHVGLANKALKLPNSICAKFSTPLSGGNNGTVRI